MHDFIVHATDAGASLAVLWAHVFRYDLIRYLIGAGGVFLVVNLALRGPLAGRKIRKNSPQFPQMRREFLSSLRTAGIFAIAGLIAYFGRKAGIIHTYAAPGERGWLYFAFSITALIVLHDAWFYWTHRLIHHPALFKRWHGLHHKSKNPSPWTAYAFNVGEAGLNAIFVPIVLVFITACPLAIFIFLGHMMLRNAIGHSGYELFPSTREGRPLFDWMTTVTHHDLHHAEAGWNYGFYFTWWDRLMGTEHPLYYEKFSAAVRIPLDGSAVRAITA
ncbi:MAG TPA: sterol desaturase family protein [Parvularculaceae bacterium]|nr:sterol desaturase family protein [Parvularculaceae bacterium]